MINCPSCGAVNQPVDRFCGDCGRSLVAQKQKAEGILGRLIPDTESLASFFNSEGTGTKSGNRTIHQSEPRSAEDYVQVAREWAFKDERMKAIFNLKQALELSPDDDDLVRLLDTFRCAENLPAASGLSEVTRAAKAHPIRLKLHRSHRTDGAGQPKFAFDVELELSAADVATIKEHALNAIELFSIGEDINGVGMRSSPAGDPLTVTIDTLVGGMHVECLDLADLHALESRIVAACRKIRFLLNLSKDTDREEVLEF
ncbi:MAG: hypothetical protein K8F62_17325 [Pseudorhodoplanes sp.]|nr:hypothetical protein [Pseudorhodoplanes sp.]